MLWLNLEQCPHILKKVLVDNQTNVETKLKMFICSIKLSMIYSPCKHWESNHWSCAMSYNDRNEISMGWGCK